MKIEEGKHYRTKGGQVVGPMHKWNSYGLDVGHPWQSGEGEATYDFDMGGDLWRDDGTSEYDCPTLIEEVSLKGGSE